MIATNKNRWIILKATLCDKEEFNLRRHLHRSPFLRLSSLQSCPPVRGSAPLCSCLRPLLPLLAKTSASECAPSPPLDWAAKKKKGFPKRIYSLKWRKKMNPFWGKDWDFAFSVITVVDERQLLHHIFH